MKYIRTKNAIVEYNPNEKILDTGEHIFLADMSSPNYLYVNEYSYFEKDIVKQADTIKELCDEYVIIPIDQNKKPIIHFIRHINEPIKPFATDSHIIYGAIWTDKGLIYVAKMNEKGEFELL